jgi:hypothetical protein
MPTKEFSWQPVAYGEHGPGPRSRHGLVYDEATNAIVLFGGILWKHNGILLSDTWELREGHWSKIEVTTEPPARHRGGLVYDPVARCSVLFGGQTDRQFMNDTWIYKDDRWKAHGWWFTRNPRRRCGHAMAFYPDMSVTVLFGGMSQWDLPLGDTWLFDGHRWFAARVRRPVATPRWAITPG